MRSFDGTLLNVDATWYYSVVSHFDQLAEIYSRAAKNNALDSDFFNFDFDSFDRSFELTKFDNRDWGDKAQVESSLRDLIHRLRKHDSLYLKLLLHKQHVALIWDDPVAVSAGLEVRNANVERLMEGLRGKIANLDQIVNEQTRRRTIVSQSDHFSKLACQYCREANRWLVAIGFLAAAALYFGWSEITGNHDEVVGAQALYHLIAGRVILVTAGVYLMRIFAQNYRQSQHNRIVNLHRSRALLAFERIIGAVDDREARGIILGKAADALFSHQSSGGVNEQQRVIESPDVRVSVTTDKPASVQ